MNNEPITSKRAWTIYLVVVGLLLLTTLAALYDGGYHTEGGVIAAIAGGSILTSLLPLFISLYLFKQHAEQPARKRMKTWGVVLYAFCFPVKLLVIYSSLSLLLLGGGAWAFG